jgi:hypothetical protein
MARSLALGLVLVLVATVSARAPGPQNIQHQYASAGKGDFPCMFCENIIKFLNDMSVDSTMMAAAAHFVDTFVCTYLVPQGFNAYCKDYVLQIPSLIKAFGDDYFNPSECAPVCNVLTKNTTLTKHEVAAMMAKLAIGLQQIKGLSTESKDGDFPCLFCENIMIFVYNMSVDENMMTAATSFVDTFVCTYLVPGGFVQYCHDYVRHIPSLIKAFANTYLNSTVTCASLCSSPEMGQQLNFLNTLAKGAPFKPSK